MESIIRDIKLAKSGHEKISWVDHYMPALNAIGDELAKEQTFKGKTVCVSVHLEAKTAYLAEVLHRAGANVIVTGSNPLSTQDDVAALVRTYGSTFTLICSKLSPEAKELIQSLNVRTIEADELYSVLKETDSIPENLLPPAPSRKSRKERFRAAFRKSNARPFFVSGALLLLMSLFALFPVYYLAAGSALLLLSAGLRLLAPA